MPTLEAVANDPDLAHGVSRDVLVRVMMSCALALMGDPKPAEAIEQALADTITTEESAKLMGISVSTLRHGASTTYKALRVQNGTRKLAWSRAAIEKFIRRRER